MSFAPATSGRSRRPLCRAAAVLSITACAAATASAQVPDGHLVVASANGSGAGFTSGSGGLFVGHPRIPGPVTPVTGLPQSLTGIPGARFSGANSVTIRSDGSLLVGEIAPPGDVVHLHILYLQGLSVAFHQPIPIGNADPNTQNGGAINAAIELPDGNILVTMFGMQNAPPLGSELVAIVSPSTGQVRPFGGISGSNVNAAVYNPETGSVFVSAFTAAGGRVGTLLEIDYPSGAQRTVGPIDNNTALDVDASGNLVASGFFGGVARIARLDPLTGAVLSSCDRSANGVAVERATDQVVWVEGGTPMRTAGSGYLDPTACVVDLGTGFSGFLTGVDVADDPRAYGAPSGAATFAWQATPAPGGLPRVGNASFALLVDDASGASTAPGFLLVSADQADLPLQGIRLLVDLTQGFSLPIVVTPGTPVALPIPANAPTGRPLFFQSVHVVQGALAASDGLRVTPLR